MLVIEKLYFPKERLSVAGVARKAQIDPATMSRIIHGKQKPGYGKNKATERIAAALGWKGDVRALFSETED